MRFLLFDVKPTLEGLQTYLDTAAALRPALDENGGCLFIDRFRDLDDPRWLLSFQLWRDERSLVAWRNHLPHRAAQAAGRARIFEDYRIRVGAVLAPGADAPGAGRLVLLKELDRPPAPGTGRRFASLYREGRYLHVEDAFDRDCAEGVRTGRVERDYGMRSRAEAPSRMDASAE